MCSFQSTSAVASWCANYPLLCSLMGGDFAEFFLTFCLSIVFLWCQFYSLFLMRSFSHFRFLPLFAKYVCFLRKAQGWWLMPKTSLQTSFKSPLCSCEHCSVNKWGRDQLPQCQTHWSICFTSPTLCPQIETFPENFVADFTAASPIMILLCLVTWLPLILCYVRNFFCGPWMWYYLEDNNLFIISFGYSCYAVISGFKYAISRKHPGWHYTCFYQNKREFVTCYVFFSLPPQSHSNFTFSLFLGLY